MLFKLLVIAAVAVFHVNADTPSSALNLFLRSQLTIAVPAYNAESTIESGASAFLSKSLEHHLMLQYFIQNSPTTSNRFLTSTFMRTYLQRQINFKRNYFATLTASNWRTVFLQYINSSISNYTDILTQIRNSQGVLATVLGIVFDLLGSTNAFRSENIAIVNFLNAQLINLRNFVTGTTGATSWVIPTNTYFATLANLYAQLLAVI